MSEYVNDSFGSSEVVKYHKTNRICEVEIKVSTLLIKLWANVAGLYISAV